MTFLALFPTLVGLLDLAAAGVYAYQRSWPLAVTRFCYAIAAYALGQVKP